MTTQSLQRTFEQKRNLLQEMLNDGDISQDTFDATLNRVKDEAFFAISVICDIDAINETNDELVGGINEYRIAAAA